MGFIDREKKNTEKWNGCCRVLQPVKLTDEQGTVKQGLRTVYTYRRHLVVAVRTEYCGHRGTYTGKGSQRCGYFLPK